MSRTQNRAPAQKEYPVDLLAQQVYITGSYADINENGLPAEARGTADDSCMSPPRVAVPGGTYLVTRTTVMSPDLLTPGNALRPRARPDVTSQPPPPPSITPPNACFPTRPAGTAFDKLQTKTIR